MSFQLDEVAKVTPEHEAYCKSLLALEGSAIGGGTPRPKTEVIFPVGRRRQLEFTHLDLGHIFVTSMT
jgi:hypothetical protein